MDWVLANMGMPLCKFLNAVGANSIGEQLNCYQCAIGWDTYWNWYSRHIGPIEGQAISDAQLANDPFIKMMFDQMASAGLLTCLNAGWVTLVLAILVIPVVVQRFRSN